MATRKCGCDYCQINDEALELAAARGRAMMQAEDKMMEMARTIERLERERNMWKDLAALGHHEIIVAWVSSRPGQAAMEQVVRDSKARLAAGA